MSRPECRGEGVERAGEAVGPAAVDVGAVQLLNVVEQSLVDRCNALEKLAEEIIIAFDAAGNYEASRRYFARLRDLTEEAE